MRRLLLASLLISSVATSGHAQAVTHNTRAEVEAFNQSLADATRRMDNAAMVALWAEDGISLLPSTPPIIGRQAIAAFMQHVTSQISGARMQSFDLACFAIDVSGDMASEWCTEHQVVLMPGGKPPFDGRGNMLLVLRKGADGKWRLEREMWNQAGPE